MRLNDLAPRPAPSSQSSSTGTAPRPDGHATAGPVPTPAEAGGSWLDLLSFRRLAVRPRWLLAASLFGVITMLMPLVHLQVFGEARILEAFATQVQDVTGNALTSEGRAMLAEQVAQRHQLVGAALGFLAALVSVLIAGGTLNLGLLLADTELSAAQALAIASTSALGVAVARVLGWGVMLASRGVDLAAARDWLHVAPSHLGVFVDPLTSPTLYTALGAVDLYEAFGVFLVTVGVTTMAPKTSLSAAVLAGSGLMFVTLLFRVTLSLAFNIPIA